MIVCGGRDDGRLTCSITGGSVAQNWSGGMSIASVDSTIFYNSTFVKLDRL